MSLQQKYLQILSSLVPIGAAGVALLLGSATPAAADQELAAVPPRPINTVSVAARLATIREATSAVGALAAKPAEGDSQLAWWAWRNGGGGWRNGGGGWRNGGGFWRNGGWGNGGWHNGWHNYWRNF
jgi:rSAM-associated Gly-rich repeat protein